MQFWMLLFDLNVASGQWRMRNVCDISQEKNNKINENSVFWRQFNLRPRVSPLFIISISVFAFFDK